MNERDLKQRLQKILKTSPDIELLARGLIEVEAFLLDEFAAKAPSSFSDELKRVIKAGGKRIRPLLVLVTGQLGEFREGEIIKAAACVEAIHTASLIHDDIIDNASFRRGVETTGSLYGNDFAIRAGDFLFARSFEILVQLGSREVLDSLATAAEELSLGELDGNRLRFQEEVKLEDYLLWISRKTASLFRAACEIGAIISGVDERQRESVTAFGFFLGMAFQLFDDILDVTGKTEELGKPAASDLKEGYLTLPYLLALNDSFLAAKIRKILRREASEKEVEELVKELAASPIIDEARRTAAEFINKAIETLDLVENEKVAETLKGIANYVIQRYY
jgi:heptaprenyl diphosphate synthase